VRAGLASYSRGILMGVKYWVERPPRFGEPH